MANAFVTIIANWVSFYDLRRLPSFSVGTIFFTFLLAFVNYIQAALVCPEMPEAGVLDLWEFHRKEGTRYVGAFVASGVMAFLANFIYGGLYNVMQWTTQNLVVVPMIAVAVTATVFVRVRWVQAVCAAAITACWTFYLVDLRSALR